MFDICWGYVGYLGPMLGICKATHVPNTHEMSIKPVRAARVTDTTGTLLVDAEGHETL